MAKRGSGKNVRPSPEALGQLAAAMAHEVRNPLNSIAIHGALLESRLRKLAPSPELDQLLKSVRVIVKDVHRIDTTLTEFMSYAGPRDLSRRTVAVDEIIAGAIVRVRALAGERGVKLDHAAVSPPMRWPVDARAIGMALDAIITNAVEASSSGGTVSVRALVDGSRGVIEVADAGHGIAAESIDRVFHIGYSTHTGRAGLGLPVAKQIVKIHGGALNASSPGQGQGATLRIVLPLDIGDDDDDSDDDTADDAADDTDNSEDDGDADADGDSSR